MSATKRVLPLMALAAVAFAIVWFTSAGAAPVPVGKGPLNRERRGAEKDGGAVGGSLLGWAGGAPPISHALLRRPVKRFRMRRMRVVGTAFGLNGSVRAACSSQT